MAHDERGHLPCVADRKGVDLANQSLERTRAGHVSCQCERARPPASLNSTVRRQLQPKETNMCRLLFAIATALCCALPCAYQARASTNVVSRLDRTIIKEPAYQSTPKYSLITLGNSGDVKVWMVEDGRRLFVDKNANGDLTDDGPPIEPSNARKLDANGWDFEYLLAAITPTNGSQHT